MELVERQARALQDKIEALRGEFETWRQRSRAKQPLEKHNSQIRAITWRLDGFLNGIVTAQNGRATFENNEVTTRQLLIAHLLWDFFRDKIALREVEYFKHDLKCADELAWHCYQPAHAKAVQAGIIAPDALKEPPLVFFSNDATPYIHARNRHFAAPGIGKFAAHLESTLTKMPISAIGVPWLQLNHVPSAVVIAHEVGHAVAQDFGLGSVFEDAIATLPIEARRLVAWKAWSHEMFADVYGILCTGPAYVLALRDYLLAEPGAVEHETITEAQWLLSEYPTTAVRMRLNFEVLEQLGFTVQPERDQWLAAYPKHQMAAFEPDIPLVVQMFLEKPLTVFGAAQNRLRDVVTYTATNHQRVEEYAQQINNNITIQNREVSFRFLFAAAAIAYEKNPAKYQQHHATLQQRMLKTIPVGIRYLPATSAPPRNQADEQATGAALLALFA